MEHAQRVELSSGAWFEHRGEHLKGRDKRVMAKAGRILAAPSTDDFGAVDKMAFATSDVGDEIQAVAWSLIITAWSFDGLVLPTWNEDHLKHGDSLDEIGIDDLNEMEAVIAPYQVKLMRRPDPKGVTTSASNGSSRAKAASSRKG